MGNLRNKLRRRWAVYVDEGCDKLGRSWTGAADQDQCYLSVLIMLRMIYGI